MMLLVCGALLVFSITTASCQPNSCSQSSEWRTRCNAIFDDNVYNVSYISVLQNADLTGNVSSPAVEYEIDTAAEEICSWYRKSTHCEKELVETCYPNSFSSVVDIWMRLTLLRSCEQMNWFGLLPGFLTCNYRLGLIESFQWYLQAAALSRPPNPYQTGLEHFDDICLALQQIRSRYSDDEMIATCGREAAGYTALLLESTAANGFECVDGTSHIFNIMNPVLSLPARPPTTPDPWATSGTNPTFSPWETTSEWRPPTTGYPWWLTTTDHNWRPTTSIPGIDIPEYLLRPFNATCRKGQMQFSETHPDLVDAVSMVFDGDNTLNCRLILNDLHHWILAQMGETRQKRAFDQEPIKVTCTRGNLTVSNVDPGTSESTDLVFQTGASKRCITVFGEFLTYITSSFK